VKIGRHASLTDTGRRRLGNEDAFVVEPPLFMIADGMGGARAGEIAAGLAAAVFEDAGDEIRGGSDLSAIIADANRRIWERSLVDPATAGMGTTITVAIVDEPAGRITFGHVGDSRAYRVRNSEIEQLTTDHSLVAELVESGVLTPEEAERHPQRSAITRALGTESAVEADILTIDVEDGDLFLLCSDGLSDMLTDQEMADAIASAGSEPQRAAEALVSAANARGGEDNVTVVLFEMLESRSRAEEGPTSSASIDGTQGPDTAELRVPVVAREADTAVTTVENDSTGRPRRFGAGPGGRATALLLVAGILGVGILALYVALTR
jgi:serine/threonine protein phosphatase PrpC